MSNQSSPINKALYPAGLWDDYLLTHAGSLIGALELSGVDPQGYSTSDLASATNIMRNLVQSQHPETSLTQYYWHYEGAKVVLKERTNKRSRMLSERRADFMNDKRNLATSRLYWMLDVPTQANLNKLLSASALKMIFSAPFERTARAALKARFDHWGAWLVERSELRRQADLLSNSLRDLDVRLGVISPENTKQSPEQLWALCRAIVNLRPEYLEQAQTEGVPVDDWDRLLADGDIYGVNIDGVDFLKIDGPEPVYARIASVIGYGAAQTPYGMWGAGSPSPIMQKGNYLIVARARPMSALDKGLMLKGKSDELARSQIKFSQLLRGEDVTSEIDKKINDSPILKKKRLELEEAANSPDRSYYYHSHVIVFDKDPSKIKTVCSEMHTALTQSHFRVVWESVGMADLFPMLLPAYPKRCFRSVEFTASQVGACSLGFRAHNGIPTWGGKNNVEEAVYILENEDGSPFHYSPYVGDKALTLIVGPSRSGKSFTKNVMAGHYLKFSSQLEADHNATTAALGSLYHSVDVDAGTEGVAMFFGDEGGIFRIEDLATDRGFSLFCSCRGPDDSGFMHHAISQIRIMLSLNDSDTLRTLEPDEQQQLDDAIVSIIADDFPQDLKTLSTLYDMVGSSLRQKLSRWVRAANGMYANQFDNDVDGIGNLHKRIAVYNLAGVKDRPALAQLHTNEIFFRVSRVFEDIKYRSVPKMMSIDEAQCFFSIPGAVEMAVAKARTWFKHNGGMEFWTQDVNHFGDIPGWDTLRSSASTWIFMADGAMNIESYKRVYPDLTDGECEAIRKLKPRQQFYIIQREAGISKLVNLFVAPEEYVLATSSPDESLIVRQMLEQHTDIDVATSEMVRRIFKKKRG
ncbi:VirB4 family type IV secretion system protein [Pseudomonas savastanoi]|uniref:VirB4 family type IV secretion system protein n=1 Tax=Pseudomonas savastanoi TaxID=29438 RepID=UPI000E32567A|nr:VirB4 family type IV secretion system protein [Pseudomonas savastanoi]